jgi:hypothetical protein
MRGLNMTTFRVRGRLRVLPAAVGILICIAGLARGQTSQPIDISGQVVDDETGKPISQFAQEGGRVDEKDPSQIHWGYSLQTQSKNPKGQFSAHLDWAGGWRERIVASGYVSQPILTEPPKDGKTKITKLVIRMKRGARLSGHVLDFKGNPVSDAGVYVVGSRSINLTGGKAVDAVGEGAEDRLAIRAATDAAGAFNVTGIGDDAQRLAISCSAIDLWVASVPTDKPLTDGLDIHLPEPGKLVVHYEIDGAPETARLFMQLHTWEMPGWSGVENNRHDTVKQHGELVIDNLTPGQYDMTRIKKYMMNGIGGDAMLDRRKFKIESGKTTTTDFTRPRGAAITGQVFGVEPEEVAQIKPTALCISVQRPEEKDPFPQKLDQIVLNPRDVAYDGKFATERLAPGQYKVKAELFVEETPEQRMHTGLVPPGYTGEALVTVPEAGAPEPVKIELARYHR